MKLLIYISSLASGGAERATTSLANYWADKGWEITILTLAPSSKDFYRLNSNVRRMALNLHGDSPNLLIAIYENTRRIFLLRKILHQLQPDVAISMMDSSNIQLALASSFMPSIVAIGSERCHPPHLQLKPIWSFMRRYLYRNLDAVVALTRETCDWLSQYTNARHIVLIPNMINYPLQSNLPLIPVPIKSGASKLVLAVGRLSHQKGFSGLIEAFSHLSTEFPEWSLVILGEGPERDALLEQAVEARLGDRISLPGQAGNVGEWYEAADIYVMSSNYEGFPNALLEAMAYGLPAISMDCETGPRDIIHHEVNGLLVPLGDMTTLSQSLYRLMNDESLRRRYAKYAVEVRDRFSQEKVVALWEKLFIDRRNNRSK